MEYERICWGVFTKTGDIDAYLLHAMLKQATAEKEGKAWGKSEQRHW